MWVVAGPGVEGASRIIPPEDAIFAGSPSGIYSVDEKTLRPPETSVRACFEALSAELGCSFDDVDLLLIFAPEYASSCAQRVVEIVDSPAVRIRPRDSVAMETAEPVRAALSSLDAGSPQSTIIVGSAYSESQVAELAAASALIIVMRFMVFGTEAAQTDIYAALMRGGVSPR